LDDVALGRLFLYHGGGGPDYESNGKNKALFLRENGKDELSISVGLRDLCISPTGPFEKKLEGQKEVQMSRRSGNKRQTQRWRKTPVKSK